MRLGLLADIHESLTPLRHAIELFKQSNVDEIIVLGDICRMHHHLEETVLLLRQVQAVGVWGNHDFGLCHQVSDKVSQTFSPEVLQFTTTLQPRLVREDCLMTHVEPWLDTNNLTDLWYFEGLPDSVEKLQRSFQAVPQRVLFSGHVHQWYLATPEGPSEWQGEGRIRLAPPQRYLLIVHAVCAGHAAIYETETGWLTPLRLKLDEEEE